MRLSSLCALVPLFAVGCAASSPQPLVYSEAATSLRLSYASDAGRVADALQRRGCAQGDGFAFECPYQGADGASYAVVVDAPAPGPSAPLVARDEPTEVATTEPRQGREGVVSADGTVVQTGPEPVELRHTLPRERRGAAPDLALQVRARVVDPATGGPVRLAGDDAAALRESLRALLVEDLPVVRAYYTD